MKKIYTSEVVAGKLGLHLYELRVALRDGIISGGSVHEGAVMCWTDSDLAKCRKEWRNHQAAEIISAETVAGRLGIAVCTLITYVENGILTAGSFKAGSQMKWTVEEFARVEKDWEEFKHLLPTTVFANLIGVSSQWLANKIETGEFPKPDFCFGKRKLYDARKVEEYKKAVETIRFTAVKAKYNVYGRQKAEQRRQKGFFSVIDVAKLCGVGTVSIYHHISKGKFPEPKHSLAGFNGVFYTKKEADKIVAWYQLPTNIKRGPKKKVKKK